MNDPIYVVGAGAAGLVASIFAASTTAVPVAVIESTADGGRKILISGGGRCNVLPSALEPERFVTDSPSHRMRAMLRSWPLIEQRAFFEQELGVPLALEEDTGKLFPRSNRARDVRDALVAAARARGVTFSFNTTFTRLEPSPAGWQLQTSRGVLPASRVILATGGLSVTATGSTGVGLREAARLEHVLHDPYPALTPLIAGGSPHEALSGVSLPARIRARARRQDHRGRRRLPLYAQGLQRPVGSRRVARRGAQPDERWRARDAPRAVVVARCGGVGIALSCRRRVLCRR